MIPYFYSLETIISEAVVTSLKNGEQDRGVWLCRLLDDIADENNQ